jgi:ribosomal-protein-alanine N-acetyltransferase
MKSERDNLPYRIDDMQLDDIDEVMAIEQRSFSSPWSARAYRYELTSNSFSQFIVVREQSIPKTHAVDQERGGPIRRWLGVSRQPVKSPVLGYAGLWLLADEAHISTIAVIPEWRGQGLGEFLLVALLERSAVIQAEVVTLEVRASNLVAQNLYRKYQFQTVGLRRAYYQDNLEDALVMTTPPLRSPGFQETFQRNKATLFQALKENVRRPRRDRAVLQMG